MLTKVVVSDTALHRASEKLEFDGDAEKQLSDAVLEALGTGDVEHGEDAQGKVWWVDLRRVLGVPVTAVVRNIGRRGDKLPNGTGVIVTLMDTDHVARLRTTGKWEADSEAAPSAAPESRLLRWVEEGETRYLELPPGDIIPRVYRLIARGIDIRSITVWRQVEMQLNVSMGE